MFCWLNDWLSEIRSDKSLARDTDSEHDSYFVGAESYAGKPLC